MARPARGPARCAERGGFVIRLLEVGAAAPDFTLGGSDGRSHTLSRLLRDGHVMLVFYPGNDTPG